jgi:hypothetical protein
VFQPYVADISFNIWGRDIMKEMNVKISKDSGSLGKQIIQWMGYQEG